MLQCIKNKEEKKLPTYHSFLSAHYHHTEPFHQNALLYLCVNHHMIYDLYRCFLFAEYHLSCFT